MKKFQLVLSLVFFATIFIGCAGHGKTIGRKLHFEDRFSLEGVDPPEADMILPRDQNVSPTVFAGNERQWQESELQNFLFPVMWLQQRDLGKQIYVVKQVGASSLFCLIRPNAVEYKSRKKSAEYSLFLIKKMEGASVNSSKMLRTSFSGAHEVAKVGEIEVTLLNASGDHYWDAPRVMAKSEGSSYEMTLLYRGLSQSYVNRLMNKFPWRALARSN